MTTKTAEEQLEEITQALRLPTALACYGNKLLFGAPYQVPPHVLLIEQKVLAGVLDNSQQSLLMVNLPPRHGKSFYMMWLCAWLVMMFPHKRIMYVTYSDDFSVVWGRRVKKIIETLGPKLAGVTISKDASANSDWTLENGMGGMLSVGINGNITGRDADIVVVDDVLKDSKDANSKAVKKAIIDQFDSAIRPRLEPGGTMIIISTRWAEDDLAGTLQQREHEDPGADQWTKVILPALAEPSEDEQQQFTEEADFALWEDELGRHLGEALWPERFNTEHLHKLRANNPINFATLYQQTPNVREGGLFPIANWQYYDPAELPPMSAKTTRWDLAASDNAGDYTVGLTLGRGADGKMYVLEVQRFRSDSITVETRVKNTAYRQGVGVTIGIEQERAGAGKTVIAFYQRTLRGFTVKGDRPEGSKEDRAAPVSGHVAGGLVLLPEGAEWLTDFLHEFKLFPRGKNDDQVDCLVYAFNELYEGSGGVEIWSSGDLNLDAEQQMRALLQASM
jgi:predicted phage terminase large subunit-like protein